MSTPRDPMLNALVITPHGLGVVIAVQKKGLKVQTGPGITGHFPACDCIPYTMPATHQEIGEDKVLLPNGAKRCYKVRVTCSKHNLSRFYAPSAIRGLGGCVLCQKEWAGKSRILRERILHGETAALALLEKVRAMQVLRPSRPEIAIMQALGALGVDYTHQLPLLTPKRNFLLDFAHPDLDSEDGLPTWAIEFNGAYWHGKPHKVARDLDLANFLRWHGVPLLVVTEDDLPALARPLSEFLAQVA